MRWFVVFSDVSVTASAVTRIFEYASRESAERAVAAARAPYARHVGAPPSFYISADLSSDARLASDPKFAGAR